MLPLVVGWYFRNLSIEKIPGICGNRIFILMNTTSVYFLFFFVSAQDVHYNEPNAYWKACNFIKEEPLAQVFSCEFCEFLRTLFLHNSSGRLPLYWTYQDVSLITYPYNVNRIFCYKHTLNLSQRYITYGYAVKPCSFYKCC